MEKNENTNFQAEPLAELTTDTEDCKNVLDFFSHFKIEVPDYLKTAIENFQNALESKKTFTKDEKTKDPELLDAQNIFRLALCRAMGESEHPLFKDELFKAVIDNSEQVVFNANFDKQVVEALSVT